MLFTIFKADMSTSDNEAGSQLLPYFQSMLFAYYQFVKPGIKYQEFKNIFFLLSGHDYFNYLHVLYLTIY